MVNVMAPVDPELIEMDWSVVPSLVQLGHQPALPRRAAHLDHTPGSSRALLAALPQLTRKHTVLVASVTDPTVIDASARPLRTATPSTAQRPPSGRCSTRPGVRRHPPAGADDVTVRPTCRPPATATSR
jgi:hypothetical protein